MQTSTLDIIERLQTAALGVDDMAVEDLEALLSEAAETIETLRLLVDAPVGQTGHQP